MAAKSGESFAAEWGDVDQDARLHVPAEVTEVLPWFTPGCEVLIELSDQGSIFVHGNTELAAIIEQRQELVEQLGGALSALRRAAASCAVFRISKIGKSNRRITLHEPVLLHLGIKKGERVLCLAYANRIELLNTSRATEVIDHSRHEFSIRSRK